MARVKLDSGEGGLSGGGGRGNNSRSGIGSNSIGSSSIGSISKGSSGIGSISSMSQRKSIGQRSRGQDGGGDGQGLSGGGSGPLGPGGGFVKGSLEFSLGSSDLRGVFDGGRSGQVEHGLGQFGDGGDGQIGSLDTEAKSVSDVVGGLDDAVGIDVGVRALDASVGVADLVLLAVDVGVAVLDIAELVLSLELGRGVQGSSGHNGGRGSSLDNGCSGSVGKSSSLDDGCSSSIGKGSIGSISSIGSCQDLGLRGCHAGSKKNL